MTKRYTKYTYMHTHTQIDNEIKPFVPDIPWNN